MVNAKCTNCGAAIRVDERNEAGVCPYCKSAYITEKAIKNVNNTTNNSAQVINNYYNTAPSIEQSSKIQKEVGKTIEKDGYNVVRFLLTFFLGFIGSFIINHTTLKPEGNTSRTTEYFFWGLITCGVYILIASLCNLLFNPNLPSNVGYIKDKDIL